MDFTNEPRFRPPLAIRRVLAGGYLERLWHYPAGCGFVCPNTTFRELSGDIEFFGAVEDFGGKGNHAPYKAGKVLAFGSECDHFCPCNICSSGYQDVVTVFGHGAEENVFLGHLDGFFVHIFVLLVSATE